MEGMTNVQTLMLLQAIIEIIRAGKTPDETIAAIEQIMNQYR